MWTDAARRTGGCCSRLRLRLRLATALLGACACAGVQVDAASVSDRIAAGGADRLGESRLFFSKAQRRAAVAQGEKRNTGPRRAGTAAMDGATTEPRPGAASPSARPPRILFQALLRVGKRVQLIIDDRPCRIVARARTAAQGADEATVRCTGLPDEVRSLALSMRDGRLVVTLSDGRWRRLDVGEALRP